MRYFITLVLILFICCSVNSADQRPIIILVGVQTQDLAQEEDFLIDGKQVIYLPNGPGWSQEAQRYAPQEIILKQSSGFVGLYTPSGMLVREVMISGKPLMSKPLPPPVQSVPYPDYNNQLGYNTGGRVDGLQPMSTGRNNINSNKLPPGWGYSEIRKTPSKKAIFLNLLAFAPLQVATPFSYPGLYGPGSLSMAYATGVVPHIGAMAVEMNRAKQNQQAYQNSIQPMPIYAEYPVQYYNSTEPSNPITADPNMDRINPMPEAFTQQNPNYDYASDYYQLNGQPLP